VHKCPNNKHSASITPIQENVGLIFAETSERTRKNTSELKPKLALA